MPCTCDCAGPPSLMPRLTMDVAATLEHAAEAIAEWFAGLGDWCEPDGSEVELTPDLTLQLLFAAFQTGESAEFVRSIEAEHEGPLVDIIVRFQEA